MSYLENKLLTADGCDAGDDADADVYIHGVVGGVADGHDYGFGDRLSQGYSNGYGGDNYSSGYGSNGYGGDDDGSGYGFGDGDGYGYSCGSGED